MLVYKPGLDSLYLYGNILLFENKKIISTDVEEYLDSSF